MFHMSNDSHLFQSSEKDGHVPLYEAKMFWHYDHRWASYNNEVCGVVGNENKFSVEFEITPRYWVEKAEVDGKLRDKWGHDWCFAFRNVSDSRNERTFVSSIVPLCGLGNSASLILPKKDDVKLICCLLTNLNSLLLDFVARLKIPGMNINYFMVEQLPVLAPSEYSVNDKAFIVPRVIELTYASYEIKSWASDLGYEGEPYSFDPDRRAIIRAELDAYYAKLYGLTRDELRYIIDPADVMGADYPSETFRVLKNNEIKEFGEYRTQRLVLREFDRLTLAEANGEEYTSLLVPPPGQQADPTYASVGVFRDHEDAQLAGLIWAAIATGGASQAEIRGLLTLLTLPQALDIYLSHESLAAAKNLFNKYQPLFTQERINHADTIISHFKRQTWVRTDSKGILSVSTHNVPDGIQVNDELTTLAEHLLVAAKASLQSDKQQTGADTETSTKSA
jgi:hypothetical protein